MQINFREIKKLPIGLIRNIHYKYREVLGNQEIANLYNSNINNFTPYEAEKISSLYPIPVMIRDSKYYCIGEINLFLNAKKVLQKDSNIYVRIFEGKINKEFYEIMNYELVVKPALNRINKREYNLLYRAYLKLLEFRSSKNKITIKENKKSFSQWIGCDARYLK